MASFATMQIIDVQANTVITEISLRYIMGVGIWTCPQGYLGTNTGTWDSYIFTPDLDLFDEKGKTVARCWNVDGDWFGYPLSGHEGRTGNFSAHRGVLFTRFTSWKLVSV